MPASMALKWCQVELAYLRAAAGVLNCNWWVWTCDNCETVKRILCNIAVWNKMLAQYLKCLTHKVTHKKVTILSEMCVNWPSLIHRKVHLLHVSGVIRLSVCLDWFYFQYCSRQAEYVCLPHILCIFHIIHEAQLRRRNIPSLCSRMRVWSMIEK